MRVDNLPRGGYMGKTLRINLTHGTFMEEKVDPRILRLFIGGVGLGIKMLYGEVPVHIRPYDPENRLFFLTGPLTGTSVPGSGMFEVISKSPLTGFVCSAQANGHFGARLKWSGYDGLIVEGKSPTWVYLYIQNGVPEIRDASFLSGKTVWETEGLLNQVHGRKDSPVSVASIGPSGERGVRFSAIISDFGHVAATGGVGSVMGSKNLKAVVVQGDFKVPVEADVEPLVRRLTREWTRKAMTVGPGSLFSKWGTQIVFTSYHKLGWVPVKNLTTNLFPEAGRFDAKYLREQVFKKVKRTPCHACTYDHCRTVEIIDGPYKGLVLEDPEYEDLAGWGPNVGVTDPRAAAMLTHVNDGLGMDLKECSFTISLAMECYEKGLLTPKDTEGIDLSWGNVEGILQLMKKISDREGIGDLLADGVKRSADRIGREAPQWAVYVKRGIAPHIHDPRTRWGTLFAEAISDTGSIDGIDFTTRNSEDLGIHEPTADPDERVAFAQAKSGPLRHVEDSIMNCYFFDRGPGILSIMVDVLNAVTGFEYSTEELLKTGDRITNLLRVFNIREGLVPEDDSLSPRLLTPPETGPQKGKSFLETFSEVLRTYYREKGWDERTGKPLPETLKKLQLDDVIEDIW
jgi:aldehyde:ferredoxin oxidoreductase